MNTVDYFIEKFEAIPAGKWTTGKFVEGDKCDAMGHCGERTGDMDTDDSENLFTLVLEHLKDDIANINDGDNPNFKQKTAKGRVLAALRYIKKYQYVTSND